MISNLLGNAVQHSARDTPIQVWLDGRQEEAVELAVHNVGPAIPASLRERLFEPFYSVDEMQEGPARTGGAGLGLFITRQLVVSHGGDIAFTTGDEHGTTFKVRLPRHSAD